MDIDEQVIIEPFFQHTLVIQMQLNMQQHITHFRNHTTGTEKMTEKYSVLMEVFKCIYIKERQKVKNAL